MKIKHCALSSRVMKINYELKGIHKSFKRAERMEYSILEGSSNRRRKRENEGRKLSRNFPHHFSFFFFFFLLLLLKESFMKCHWSCWFDKAIERKISGFQKIETKWQIWISYLTNFLLTFFSRSFEIELIKKVGGKV